MAATAAKALAQTEIAQQLPDAPGFKLVAANTSSAQLYAFHPEYQYNFQPVGHYDLFTENHEAVKKDRHFLFFDDPIMHHLDMNGLRFRLEQLGFLVDQQGQNSRHLRLNPAKPYNYIRNAFTRKKPPVSSK
jgi:hypothetical protein